jgi:hypothetical protein
MEVRQAIADLAEVRDRLAKLQRFEGYSGWAAMASGFAAIAAGALQFALVPHPAGATQQNVYLTIWLGCLVVALAINYGAILIWRTRNNGAQARVQIRTVGMTILPAIVAGGVITAALVSRGVFDLLPGLWCTTYGLGIFASRAMVPRDVAYIAAGFGAFGALLLLIPGIGPLDWWVMPAAFGLGQIAIGAIVRAAGSPVRINTR